MSLSARRAWIETVDYVIDYVNDAMSLSARRAWIETIISQTVSEIIGVALRKESVDRNQYAQPAGQAQSLSLSARRAWIEILPPLKLIACHNVALRKESVDRNIT